MSKIVIVAINAKYIHTNIAVRYLKKYAINHYGIESKHIKILEFTINNDENFILKNIILSEPNVLCFSSYIWNIEIIKNIADNFNKISPDCPIFLGGPEVSYNSVDFLKKNQYIKGILYGEGEVSFSQLCSHFIHNKALSEIDSLIYKDNFGNIIENKKAHSVDMAKLDFPYNNDLSDVQNQIFYYEASRGCPFNCQYCLSSIDKKVRFRPLELVFEDLKIFLNNKVRQVKFVDRTFNCNKKYAMSIWKFLHYNDNGISNFHFEISADLLDEETINFLSNIRAGLFQFEIGIQTTNPTTAHVISRNAKFHDIKKSVNLLSLKNNIHLHLDLIAGLPFENYLSFKKSFNDVYKLKPHQFQLGFLKLLKGSGLYVNSEKYGIVYSSKAPYEVLKTNDLTYKEIIKLKNIEELIEIYYNSSKFTSSINMILENEDNPFSFYESFSNYWEKNELFNVNHNRYKLFDILFNFIIFKNKFDNDKLLILKELLLFDLCKHEKPKKLPICLSNFSISSIYRDEILLRYSNDDFIKNYLPVLIGKDAKYIHRVAHTEYFKFSSKYISKYDKEIYIVFDYSNKDILGNAKFNIFPK